MLLRAQAQELAAQQRAADEVERQRRQLRLQPRRRGPGVRQAGEVDHRQPARREGLDDLHGLAVGRHAEHGAQHLVPADDLVQRGGEGGAAPGALRCAKVTGTL